MSARAAWPVESEIGIGNDQIKEARHLKICCTPVCSKTLDLVRDKITFFCLFY